MLWLVEIPWIGVCASGNEYVFLQGTREELQAAMANWIKREGNSYPYNDCVVAYEVEVIEEMGSLIPGSCVANKEFSVILEQVPLGECKYACISPRMHNGVVCPDLGLEGYSYKKRSLWSAEEFKKCGEEIWKVLRYLRKYQWRFANDSDHPHRS